MISCSLIQLAREQKLPNTFASDTWAVGCLAVRVAVGEPPWAAAAKRGNAALLYTVGSFPSNFQSCSTLEFLDNHLYSIVKKSLAFRQSLKP